MMVTRCSTCGEMGHPKSPPEFAVASGADLEGGRGVLICGVCDEPLSIHTLDTHPIPELFMSRLRSSGVPWANQPGHANG